MVESLPLMVKFVVKLRRVMRYLLLMVESLALMVEVVAKLRIE